MTTSDPTPDRWQRHDWWGVVLDAQLPTHQPQDDVRVLLDPAGHPFCLYAATD